LRGSARTPRVPVGTAALISRQKGERKVKTKGWLLTCVTAFLLLGMSVAISPAAEEAPRMTIENLKEMMGSPDLVILDVRYGIGWTLSLQKIKGALREDSKEETKQWAGKYSKDMTIVTYCA
jgi:hypothetical protein